MYPERSAALETRLPGIEKLRKSHEPLEKCTTRAKARNFIAQCLSGFENPLPRTKVRGYTRTSVFPQAVKLWTFLKAEFACELFWPQLMYPERSAALETRLPGIEKLRKSHEPLEKCTTRAKARNFIAQCLSGFENPLPRTKVRGYTRTSVFPQAVKLWTFLKAEFACELFWPQLMYPERSAALETRLPGIEKLRKSHEPLEKCTTRAKARNFIAQCLSEFENPLPRTKIRGYTRTSVFPQAVKLCPSLKAEFSRELFWPQLMYPERSAALETRLPRIEEAAEKSRTA